ncbi:transcriptional regulator [Actinomycetota bacterium]|nr:transcriptional regulator [Actinomycetota bacterium]
MANSYDKNDDLAPPTFMPKGAPRKNSSTPRTFAPASGTKMVNNHPVVTQSERIRMISNASRFAPSGSSTPSGRVVGSSGAVNRSGSSSVIQNNGRSSRTTTQANSGISGSDWGGTRSNGPGDSDSQNPPKKRHLVRKIIICVVVAILVTAGAIAWHVYSIYNDLVNGVQTQDVLSTMADDGTGAEVTLIVGSDARSPEAQTDVIGARADTIMLLVHSKNGSDSLVSIPRDTMVQVPEFVDTEGFFEKPGTTADIGLQKINSSYAYGGPKLLIRTVEYFTELKVDHYIEVGFDSIRAITYAVDGIELCYDWVGVDWDSDLVWPGGCNQVDGDIALAFSRMRYSDPLGDVGRAARQHQVVQKLADKIKTIAIEGTFWNLYNIDQLGFIGKTAEANLMFDKGTDIWHLRDVADQFESASAGQSTDPESAIIPIKNPSYMDGVLGSVVKVDYDEVAQFMRKTAVK